MSGRRIGRWLLRIGILIVSLLVIMAACVLFALGTDTGTRWTVALAGRWVPEFVQWESLSGRLAGPLELQGLEVDIAPVHLRAERIVLDWHPWGLISRRVHFDSIRVTGALVDISQADSVVQTGSSEIERPSDSGRLALPVDLQVDRLAMVGATVSVTDLIEVYDVSVDFSGRPDAYDVAIAATAAAPEWHEVHVVLAGQGDLESMRLESLTAVSPAGQIELVGDVRWLPHPIWDVQLVGSDIDPVAASDGLADWPGSLALRAHAEGAWSDSLILEASIDTIHGRLRSEPVQAKAEVQVSDDTYLIDDLHVLWGPVRLQADGIWSDTFNLSFDAEIPELDQVVPDAAGSISIAGRGRGSVSAPGLVADVIAAGLRWQDLQLDQLSCTMDVTPGGLQPSRIDIDARGIAGLPVELDSVRATVDGIRSDHNYRLLVWGSEGRAELSGAGVLADTTWNSRLTELEIESARAGVWQLVQPVEIDLADERAEWSPLCLETDTGMVCVAGQVGPETRRLDAQIESLALNGLRPFMPEGWDLAGRLNADVRAEFDSTGRPRGALNIAPGPGWLALPAGSLADTIHFEQVRIGLSTDGDSLAGELSLAVAPGAGLERATVSAGLSLSGLAAVAFDSTLDLLRVLEHGPWSAHLQVANVHPEHLQGRGPEFSLDEPVTLKLQLSSRDADDLTGLLDLFVPAGAFEFTLGDDTTMLHWEPSHAVLRIDSTGMHGDFQSALELDDTTRLGQVEAAATLPALTSLGALSVHQPLEASLEGQLDLAVLDAITRTFANTTGQVSVHVNVTGSTADAQLLGTIELAGRTDVTPLGIALEEVTFTAEGRKDGIEYSGGARSGAGRIAMDGRATRIPSEESPTTLHVQGTDFEILAGPQVQMVVSPDLDIRSTGTQLDITGEVLIPRAAIRVLEVPESAVQVSDDVVFVGPDAQVDTGGTIVTSRVQVRLGDDVHFRGFGFSSFLDGGLELVERPGQPTQGRGELTFREGRYQGFGQNLTVEPGRLLFEGPVDNPGVDVTAFRIADDRTRAGFKISGTIQDLVTETFSEPARTRDETMSYILFGRPLNQGSESDQMHAAGAAAVVGGSMLAMQAATKVGLDDARIEPGTKRNDAAFFAGKYLSPRLYVAYGTGIYESINTLRVRYILNRNWTLQAETGTREAADIVYQIERGD